MSVKKLKTQKFRISDPSIYKILKFLGLPSYLGGIR